MAHPLTNSNFRLPNCVCFLAPQTAGSLYSNSSFTVIFPHQYKCKLAEITLKSCHALNDVRLKCGTFIYSYSRFLHVLLFDRYSLKLAHAHIKRFKFQLFFSTTAFTRSTRLHFYIHFIVFPFLTFLFHSVYIFISALRVHNTAQTPTMNWRVLVDGSTI